MPTPRTPSLTSILASQVEISPPVCDWIQELKTEEELVRLLLTVRGIPTSWLEWAEKKAKSVEKRKGVLQYRVGYVLSTLWSGVTLLQECKFLCDLLENALRTGFINWVVLNKVTYGHLTPTIPSWRKITDRNPHLRLNDGSMPFPAGAVIEFDFYQLTETIVRNWRFIPAPRTTYQSVRGFCNLFRHDARCRDVAVFERHMKFVRGVRNDIAHSKRLFDIGELRKLNKVVCTWLKPLNIELMEKVAIYRSRRPNFLHYLDAP